MPKPDTSSLRLITRQMASQEAMSAIHSHELQHQRTVLAIEKTVVEEAARRHSTKSLVLEATIDELNYKLASTEDCAHNLAAQLAQQQAEVECLTQRLRETEVHGRSREKAIADLHAELAAVTDSMRDAEAGTRRCHALSSELAKLQPEVEHLRTQMADYQMLVTEKLKLEQNLVQVRAELESERNARCRVQIGEEELRGKLNELEKMLAIEQQESGVLRKDAQNALSNVAQLHDELNGVKALLVAAESTAARLKVEAQVGAAAAVSEMEALKKELQSEKQALLVATKELAEKQNALDKMKISNEQALEINSLSAQLSHASAELASVKSDMKKTLEQQQPKPAKPIVAAGKLKRKQNTDAVGATAVQDQGVATFLDTPEAIRRTNKKRPLDLVAEKSTFSITPFLNKTQMMEEAIGENDELEDSILKAGGSNVKPPVPFKEVTKEIEADVDAQRADHDNMDDPLGADVTATMQAKPAAKRNAKQKRPLPSAKALPIPHDEDDEFNPDHTLDGSGAATKKLMSFTKRPPPASRSAGGLDPVVEEDTGSGEPDSRFATNSPHDLKDKIDGSDSGAVPPIQSNDTDDYPLPALPVALPEADQPLSPAAAPASSSTRVTTTTATTVAPPTRQPKQPRKRVLKSSTKPTTHPATTAAALLEKALFDDDDDDYANNISASYTTTTATKRKRRKLRTAYRPSTAIGLAGRDDDRNDDDDDDDGDIGSAAAERRIRNAATVGANAALATFPEEEEEEQEEQNGGALKETVRQKRGIAEKAKKGPVGRVVRGLASGSGGLTAKREFSPLKKDRRGGVTKSFIA